MSTTSVRPFRCFSTHWRPYVCTGGAAHAPVRKCPNCGSDMTLRQKTSSSSDQPTQISAPVSYFIGCQGYPQCRTALWLPREMVEVSVLDSSCPAVSSTSRSFVPGLCAFTLTNSFPIAFIVFWMHPNYCCLNYCLVCSMWFIIIWWNELDENYFVSSFPPQPSN